MMEHRRRQALAALIDDADALLALAETGDWPTLLETEQRHRQAVEAFFSTPPAAGESLELARALRRLLNIHEHLAAAAVRERDGLADQLHGVRTGRRAVRAYAGNAA